MGSPGAGKTAVLEATGKALRGRMRLGALAGDLETDRDAQRLVRAGIPSVSITTGSACHLDAELVHRALHGFREARLDVLFIENVGNLVCPAVYDLGQAANVVALSVTEGEDKPLKYPVMFRKADLVLLTKMDLLPHLPEVHVEAIEEALSESCLRPGSSSFRSAAVKAWMPGWTGSRATANGSSGVPRGRGLMSGLFAALALAALTVGSLHTLAPDHWVPFAALGRARGWSTARTLRVTLLCGFGHVTVSALLGLVGLIFGLRMIERLGQRMEAVAGILLVGFGIAYATWGLRRAAGRRLHGHSHSHYDHIHDPGRVTAWTLFLLFSADPCVAVIPLLFAAAPLGALPATGVVLTYELATLATMGALVLPARAGARLLRATWLDRYADAVAGCVVAAVGTAVTALGW